MMTYPVETSRPVLWTYDLLIIGSSLAAVQGAVRAAAGGLRVGLIFQYPAHLEFDGLTQALAILPSNLALEHRHLWLQGQMQRWQAVYAQGALAQAGVDVITEMPSSPQSAAQSVDKHQPFRLSLGQDVLQSPKFLWVDQPVTIDYQGAAVSVLDLLAQLNQAPPEQIYILGQSLAELVLLQLVLLLGLSVAWGGNLETLLGTDDPLMVQWLAADLAQAGVKTNLSAPSDGSSVTLELKLTSDAITPGLVKVDSELTPPNIPVNPLCQTAHPQIYACGSWLAGHNLGMITQAEVNALITPWLNRTRPQPLTYKTMPWWLPTPIPIARIGWDETAARTAFPGGISVLPVQPEHREMGHGQIVLDRRHRLLGATLWGETAISAVKTLGLGMELKPVGECLAAAGWQVAVHPRQWPRSR